MRACHQPLAAAAAAPDTASAPAAAAAPAPASTPVSSSSVLPIVVFGQLPAEPGRSAPGAEGAGADFCTLQYQARSGVEYEAPWSEGDADAAAGPAADDATLCVTVAASQLELLPAFLAGCLEVCAEVSLVTSLSAQGAPLTTVPSKPASSARVSNHDHRSWRPDSALSGAPPFLMERGSRHELQRRQLQIRLTTGTMRITAASTGASDESLAFAVDGLVVESLRDGGVQVAVEAFKLSSTRCGQQRWHANFGGKFAQQVCVCVCVRVRVYVCVDGKFAQRPPQPGGQPRVEVMSPALVPVSVFVLP